MPEESGPPLCPHTGKPGKPLRNLPGVFRYPSGFLSWSEARSLSYDDAYFLEEYENQYGRTYLEDEPTLRNLARRRLDFIEKESARNRTESNPALLEIGCATGFFLSEARDRGYRVKGVETSLFASEFGRNQMGLSIDAVPFLDWNSQEQFDVIAAFFVLEHIPDQRQMLHKIESLLRPGGIFLFALPSFFGPSFRCDREGWLKQHPLDHFVDYDPGSLCRVLRLYGMDCVRIRPSSYHRERSCGFWKKLPEVLYRKFANRIKFGDTMEGFARKSEIRRA